MKIITVALMCLVVAELAYSQEPKKSEAASLQGHDEIISRLGTAYAAFNRGDFDAAVAVLVPKIEWTLLISASQSATIPGGKVSRDNRGRAEHEYDCKSNQPVRNLIQTLVLIAVSIITVWTLYMVPSWQSRGDPFLLAAVAGAITVVCLWLMRWLGSRAMRFERAMLSAFLVGMPLVYVMGWFAARDHPASSWIWVELLGLALFAAFAALGLKNSPWFLAIGIVGHGVAWDSWHYENSAYIPNWYAVACLLVDLTLGAYLAARVPVYREEARIAKKN